MTTDVENSIRLKVLKYVGRQHSPVHIHKLAEDVRKSSAKLRSVADSDFRDVVQPMIVTGKLSYASGLKIKLGKKTQ